MSNDTSSSRRAMGMTLFSMVLACLVVLGLVTAFVWTEPAVQVAQLQFGLHLGARPFFVITIVFALTALIASVLIWRTSSWMKLAYGAWSVATLVLGMYVCLAGLHMMVFSAIGLCGVVGFILYGGLVYLRSALAKARGSAAGRH